MSDQIKSLRFAAVMCFVCSMLLALASSGLKGYQEKNMFIDKQLNILKSIGLVDEGQTYSSDRIEKLFSDNIQLVWVERNGRIVDQRDKGQESLPIYLYKDKNMIKAYIVPINSQGLWGRIFGYLAIKNDGSTIFGFTVYKHAETPGLGGEIEKRWFQKNFIGKKILDKQGRFVSISIAKGKVKQRIPKARQPNFVDGISGATFTGKFLSSGLKDILLDYEPVAIQFRKNRAKISSRTN